MPEIPPQADWDADMRRFVACVKEQITDSLQVIEDNMTRNDWEPEARRLLWNLLVLAARERALAVQDKPPVTH